jgi:hypothetical protein
MNEREAWALLALADEARRELRGWTWPSGRTASSAGTRSSRRRSNGGDLGQARDFMTQGLELARALGNFRGAGGESGNLSMVERQRQAGPPDEGRHFERSRAAVGDTLDRERLERAWSAGQALSSEQAVLVRIRSCPAAQVGTTAVTEAPHALLGPALTAGS